jgi:hypothetical protein
MCLLKQKVNPILKKSVNALLEQQDRHGCWSFPAHLGSHYISLYALFLEWLRFRGFSSRLDLNRLATILVETQFNSVGPNPKPRTSYQNPQLDQQLLFCGLDRRKWTYNLRLQIICPLFPRSGHN